MPQREKTLAVDYLRQSVSQLFFPNKKREGQTVGLELEVWPFRETPERGNTLIPFYNEEGTGLIQMLRELAGHLSGLEFEPAPDGAPRFRLEGGGQLTFEPGGQLEYSGPPMSSLAEAIGDITTVIEKLRCGLKKHGVWFFHSGLNPWYTVDEVGLQITKERYIHMNNYFASIGPLGQKMMRLSTSLQVNLDAGDPQEAQRRWLAANLLGPLFTAIFGNSPFVDGRATGAHSFRSLIWQGLDPSRAGIPKGFLEPDYQPCPLTQYLNFAMDAHVMRLPNQEGRLVFDGQFLPFRDWMEHGRYGFYPNSEDWETHLSTLFPEVRARGFFEIRYLDAQSKVWCSIPGILLTYLLYDEGAREQAIQLLEPYRTTLAGMLEVAAREGMNESEIAGLAKKIYPLAIETAAKQEVSMVLELCERFYQLYTHRNRNPASELIKLNNGKVFTPAQYRDFERAQVDSAGELLDIICEYS